MSVSEKWNTDDLRHPYPCAVEIALSLSINADGAIKADGGTTSRLSIFKDERSAVGEDRRPVDHVRGGLQHVWAANGAAQIDEQATSVEASPDGEQCPVWKWAQKILNHIFAHVVSGSQAVEIGAEEMYPAVD